jgi:hypothetical protein
VSTAAFALPLREEPGEDQDITAFTPASRLSPLPLRAALEAAALAPAIPETAGAPLGSFVLFQLGALAGIVFVATVAPLVVSRGIVLEAIGEGRILALLVWPLLPLVVALAATIAIANIVNRRILAALAEERQHLEGG